METPRMRLGRQEWIDAALRTLAEQGVEGVRVERIAEVLGVTKGSFYWHFKDRSALLEAVLDAWKLRATGDVIALVEQTGGDAAQRMRTLGKRVFSADGRLDRHIRSWATHDPLARTALDEIDRRRTDYLRALLLEYGFTPEIADARTLFVYRALIGQFQMGPTAQPTARQLELMIDMLLRR
jgi:AcrR family transcriptional regulator